MAENTFKLPSELNIRDGNISENFRRWKRQVQIYMAASNAGEKAPETQVAIILHCAGPEVVEVFDQFTWTDENDRNDPEKVLDKIQNFCNPRTNEVIECYRFWSVPWQDSFDIFLTELRNRADKCNFGAARDRLIRDKIIFTSQGKLLERILKEDKITLEGIIHMCQAYEQSAIHVKEMKDGGIQIGHSNKINKVSQSLNFHTAK